MPLHVAESDLALFASGDLGIGKYASVCLHTARCEACRARADAYRVSRKNLKQDAAELPAGVNWDRLAAEMTANVRVGLAAGECVAPRRKKPVPFLSWKPLAIGAGGVCVLSAAWWLNLPSSDADSLARVMRSMVNTSRPATPVAENREPADPGPMVQVSSDGVELRQNGVPVPVPREATTPQSSTANMPPAASPAHEYLTITVAVSGQTPNTKIDLPKGKDSPVTLDSYESGDTKATPRGAAYLVDFHPTLVLRNSSTKRVRSVALRVVAQETSPGGTASMSVPSLDVAPGETFSIHINQTLLSLASVQVQLDGVLFEDLSFYGPDKLQLQHNMKAWELEARQDRQYFKTLLEASGRQALQTEMLESLARQAEIPQPSVEMTRTRATNAEAGQDMQFAFLRLPDTPVELSGGARVSSNEASAPHFAVRNISKRPVRHLEIGWILKDQDGREFLAASLPADLSLAPGQSGQVVEDASLRFSGHSAIQGMRGFVSSAEFNDGTYWVPSRKALDDPQLRRVVAPSPEEQRLSQIYNKKGLSALIEELKKF
jgi:hypothetical protein